MKLALTFALITLACIPRPAGAVNLEPLRGRVDSVTAAAVGKLARAAEAESLPADALVSRALEGAARGVSPARIVAAVRDLRDRLARARGALGRSASRSELIAGASALAAGVPLDTLARLAAALPARDRTVPLVVLTDFLSRRMAQPRASSEVLRAIRLGAKDSDLLRLRNDVDHAIREGRSPEDALEAGVILLTEQRGVGSTRPSVRRELHLTGRVSAYQGFGEPGERPWADGLSGTLRLSPEAEGRSGMELRVESRWKGSGKVGLDGGTAELRAPLLRGEDVGSWLRLAAVGGSSTADQTGGLGVGAGIWKRVGGARWELSLREGGTWERGPQAPIVDPWLPDTLRPPVSPTAALELRSTVDLQTGLNSRTGPLDWSFHIGRSWVSGLGGLAWAQARAALPVYGGFSLLTGYDSRGEQGGTTVASSPGRFQLGLQWEPVKYANASSPVEAWPAAMDPQLEWSQRGASLRLHACVRGARTIEILSDLTDWVPRPLAPGSDDRWEIILAARPGVHSVLWRIDGGSWEAPAGLPASADGDYGLAGTLLID